MCFQHDVILSECAMRREHRRTPILKLGVLVHAFVAAAGVLQSGKLTLCNFVIKIAESFLQFLNSWMREKFAREKFAREKFARGKYAQEKFALKAIAQDFFRFS